MSTEFSITESCSQTPRVRTRLAQTHALMLECFLKAGQRPRSDTVQLFQLGYRHVGELR